ncbi:pentapeptide repeat-containing protein [Ruicaihuangia caeni]|uniref:pentapeptide repeat-containing protein n=1 Tax=Ruicaihuangia caeni TaxID=3042517 RepID=UPI00338FFB5B
MGAWAGLPPGACRLPPAACASRRPRAQTRKGSTRTPTTREAADLRAADLRAADLRAADLRAADLRAADLRAADLRAADLRAVDLRAVDLRAVDLRGFAALARDSTLAGAANPRDDGQRPHLVRRLPGSAPRTRAASRPRPATRRQRRATAPPPATPPRCRATATSVSRGFAALAGVSTVAGAANPRDGQLRLTRDGGCRGACGGGSAQWHAGTPRRS